MLWCILSWDIKPQPTFRDCVEHRTSEVVFPGVFLCYALAPVEASRAGLLEASCCGPAMPYCGRKDRNLNPWRDEYPILNYTILYYTVLNYATLHYAMLYDTMIHCSIICYGIV